MKPLDTLNPNDWNELGPHFDTLLAEPLTPERVPDWLQRWSDLECVLGEGAAAAGRAVAEDTADEAAEKRFLHYVQDIQPKAEVAAQALKDKLLAVPGWTPGPEHAQMVKRLRSEAALFRADNVSLGAQITTLATEYDKIAGAMAVTLDGVEQTLQKAEQRLQSPERPRREDAWRAVQSRWLTDRDALDDLFLKLLGLRRQIARNAGLPDFRAYMWQALQRFDYTPEDTQTFHRAIETEVAPIATALRDGRRRRLGVDTLRPWDLDVDPRSRPALRPFIDPAELERGVARIFARLSPELGAQFERLRPEFLDLASRRNKAPGGYCSLFPRTGLPYIFMNAVGTHGDVQTLLHEGGHAFHDLASFEGQSLAWNWGASAEFAEVASMGMELLGAPYLEASRGGFYTDEDAARARAEHLEGIIQFLPYMAVVDAFQHWVYAEAPSDVTARDMDAQWDGLWERFLPGVDWSGLEAERMTGWHHKLHIFQAPFYYVEYGLAQLGALQLWRNAQRDPQAALTDYRAALALGHTRPLPELFQAAGARLAFDAGTVGELVRLAVDALEGS